MTATKTMKPKKEEPTNDIVERERKEGMQMVKGKFRCFEPMGGGVKFSFRKFPNEPVVTYEMIDDEIYTVPKCVAEHLNENCSWIQHKYVLNERGEPAKDAGKKYHRYAFQIMEYVK